MDAKRTQQVFYQPYISDSEDDSDSSGSSRSSTSSGSSSPSVTARAASHPTTTQKFNKVTYSSFDGEAIKKDISGTSFDSSIFITGANTEEAGTKFDVVPGTYTSILAISSTDRDRNVYAQPTIFTIRLPKTYRNVSGFQITQMKLLSSFFYFRADKQNLSVSIQEQGRTIVSGGATVDNVITVIIREGTYDILTLLAELQLQLNRTPLFFYFPNGFSDFIVTFTAAGDLSVNFNQPGDTFYNSLKDQFISNPTMTQIVTTYFSSQLAGLSTYTLAQVKVAYYYPVLYEMILDPDYIGALDLNIVTSTLLAGETVSSRIIYTFQGLNDLVIQEVININLLKTTPSGVSILDDYRTNHTFLYTLVNQYTCSYETNNNRINIATSGLNTSLSNLISIKTTQFLANELNLLTLTTAGYSNLLNSNTSLTAVTTQMYNIIQENFAKYFAVNFGTYAPSFYANASNSLFIQNGIGAVGVTSNYSLSLLQSNVEPITSSVQSLKSSPGFWPQIKSATTDSSSNIIFIGSGLSTRAQDISADILNVPYNVQSSNFTLAATTDICGNFALNQTNIRMIDNSGNIYINPTFQAGDCVTPIHNGKYTVFRFRSFVRQTLQVETLPIPYYYRYPTVNLKKFLNPIPQYFNQSYEFIDSSQLTRTDISSVALTFAQSYSTGASNAYRYNSYTLTVRTPVRYFRITPPSPTSRVNPYPTLTDASGYKYPLTITVAANTQTNETFTSPLNIFLYQDQGAFFADVSGYRNENPYLYKAAYETTTDLSGISFSINAVANVNYYLIIRSANISFQNTRFQVFAWFPSGIQTRIAKYQFTQTINPSAAPTVTFPVTSDSTYNLIYAIEYDTDFIRLPTNSAFIGNDPSSATFNKYLPVTEVPLGYDIRGVSTDLTDYKGFQSNIIGNVPFSAFRVDPTTQYTFQNVNGYNAVTSNYFPIGTSNSILYPLSNAPYTITQVTTRQYKIVQWYDTNYVAPQVDQPAIPDSSFVAKSPIFDLSFGQLNGFTYDETTNALQFDNGIVGFGFLPSQGVWSVDSITVKSAYMEQPGVSGNFTDPNKSIRYLGIFQSSYVSGTPFSNVSLSNAIQRLVPKASPVVYTTSNITNYSGFDPTGGSYFTYVDDPTFTVTTTQTISGYTSSYRYDFNSNNYYSVIAFDASSNIIPFYTMMGSYVPYPLVSQPTATTSYVSPTGTVVEPAGHGFYYPTLNPTYNSNYYPADSNIYQSRYEQSIPIQTSLLHTKLNPDPTTNSNGYYYYPANTQITPLTTSQSQAWKGVDGMMCVFIKGPYFFYINNVLQGGGTTLYVNSNLSIASILSNTNVRTMSNVLSNTTTFSSTLPTCLMFTGNTSGTTNLGGMYSLWQTAKGGSTAANNYSVTFDVRTVNLNPTSKSLTYTSLGPFSLSLQYINGSPSENTQSILKNQSAGVANGNTVFPFYGYTKFFMTTNNLAIFQFSVGDTNNFTVMQNTTQISSYFCIYNYTTQSVMTFDTTDNMALFQTDNLTGTGFWYWNDLYGNPYNNNDYFDWTLDHNNNIYVLKAVESTAYCHIEITPINSDGTIGTTTRKIMAPASSPSPNINSSLYATYGACAFNEIKVDYSLNIYLQQRSQTANALYFQATSYLNSNWNLNFTGYYIRILYKDYSGTGDLTNVAISVNAQNLNAISLDTNTITEVNNPSLTLTPGFPLASQELFLPIVKNVYYPALFTQIAGIQSFQFTSYLVSIVGDIDTTVATPEVNDTAGSYVVTLGSQTITVPANNTIAQTQVLFNAAITAGGYTGTIILTALSYVPADSALIYTISCSSTIPPITLTSQDVYKSTNLTDIFQVYLQLITIYPVINRPSLWGNSSLGVDVIAFSVNNAWQVMYPTVKIIVQKSQNTATPITNTTDLTTYPSYQHTAMFYYTNYNSMKADLYNKFAQESKARFAAYDISSGYGFKSYIYNIPLEKYTGPTNDISANSGYNYLAIRGYTPTEKFECLTRFYLPGRYDFGFISLQDLSNETLHILTDLSGSPLVNPTYQSVLNQFNNSFKLSGANATYGKNAYAGYPGETIATNGFSDFLKAYIVLNNALAINSQVLATINTNVSSNVNSYITTYLSTIFPSYILNRARVTDPILFSILWKSKLSVENAPLTDEWGLGWNLGYPKADTPFDTIQRASSFFKILDDFIYLKLNPEFTMNRVDSSAAENLAITHDPQGQTNQYAAKLLLAQFGQYSQTMVQNTINFNPTLASLDKLYFQWVDKNNVQINNLDCEWNAVFQITEQVMMASPKSVIPSAPPSK